MKKNRYTILLMCLIFGSLNAQDYTPFPDDSLFFETSNVDDVLMPLVKNNTTENLIQKVNTIPEWAQLSINHSLDWDNAFQTIKLPMYSWLGKCFQDEGKLYFLSAQGDSIYIDTNISLGESYAIPLEEKNIDFGEVAYLNITFYDFFESEDGDSIKEYRFTFLDQLNAPVSFNYGETTSLDYHFDDHVFQLSKSKGIVKSPAFYYFPYAKLYSRKAKINEVLDFSTTYAYQIYSQAPGDEIHTEEKFDDFMSFHSNTRKKKVCVAQDYDFSNNVLFNTHHIWTRELSSQNFEPEITHTYSNDHKDTLYLDDYQDLNKIIPNGLGVGNNTVEGYFYLFDSKAFIQDKIEDYGFYELINDTIYYSNMIGYTSVSYKKYYQIALGGPYDEYSYHNGYGDKKIVYYNVNDIVWGEAYTESYLLSTEELEEDIHFRYNNNRLYVNKQEQFNNAAVYDLKGTMLCRLSIKDFEGGISFRDFPSGMYIICFWNDSKRMEFKLVK